MRQVPALRGLAYLVLALFVAGLLEPLVVAQTQPLVQVQVSGAPAEFTIRKSHGNASFAFTVSFACQSPGGGYVPCSTAGSSGDTNVQTTLAEVPADYPAGWEVKFNLGDNPRSTKARDSFTVSVGVRLLDDEPEKDFLTARLSASARPVTNPTLDPLVSNPLGQESRAVDSIDVNKVLNFGEQLTSWARTFMWPLLGAAVILLVAGVILVERKKGTLGLTSEAPSQAIQPGRGTSFPIRVSNEAKGDDRVSLVVSNLPPEWTAIVPLSELDLRAGERTQMWITLRAPPEAMPGQSIGFTLRARSTRGQKSADLPLQVTVVSGPGPAAVEVPSPPPAPPIEFPEETVEAKPRRGRR